MTSVSDDIVSSAPAIPTWRRIMDLELTWSNFPELLFKVESRQSSVSTEVYGGVVQFLSMASVLAVNTSQLAVAGYDKEVVASSTALSCGLACILTGIIGNLPFVCSPSLATSIYLAVYMRTNVMSLGTGNLSVFLLGLLLMVCGTRKVTDFVAWLTPISIKLGICIGLSLLVSLQALTHLKLVVSGDFTIMQLGNIWDYQVLVAMCAFVIIGVLTHHSVKGSYVIGLVFGSVCTWYIEASWPTAFLAVGQLHPIVSFSSINNPAVWICTIELFIIALIKLIGLSVGLADMAGLTKTDGSGAAPRHRWLYFSCGLATLFSAVLGSGPILLSIESAAGILLGARTGMSSTVCGLLFCLSFFLYPLWAAVPDAGTGPVLLMCALLLFENAGKVRWGSTKEAVPTFITAIFSSFTCSVLYGVFFGSAMYIVMHICTGDLYAFLRIWWLEYQGYDSLDRDDPSSSTTSGCDKEDQLWSCVYPGRERTLSTSVSYQVIRDDFSPVVASASSGSAHPRQKEVCSSQIGDLQELPDLHSVTPHSQGGRLHRVYGTHSRTNRQRYANPFDDDDTPAGVAV